MSALRGSAVAAKHRWNVLATTVALRQHPFPGVRGTGHVTSLIQRRKRKGAYGDEEEDAYGDEDTLGYSASERSKGC